MKLNCKAGDLALIVRSNLGNAGMFVTCVEIDDFLSAVLMRPIWVIDKEISLLNGEPSARISDCNLRPIRDQPGNESWFRAAPKSLPATTKGDTIDARGEVHS